jgi:phospho-N-acetylmuramoyl-pentapeptide-transferase
LNTAYTAAAISFAIAVVLGVLLLPLLTRLKFGQTVRSDGPKRHFKKMGTPTMGGIIFIPAIAISCIFVSSKSLDLFMAVAITLGFGFIGFFDDYIKIKKKRSLGLRANQKLIFQILLSALLALYGFVFTAEAGIMKLPFYESGVNLGLAYIPFTMFIVLGAVNSVNLTDGLDGLVAGIMAILGFFYTLISYALNARDISLFSAAITGGCLGFLVFNRYPARVFMGDTGALALGGALAAIAVLTNTQFYLIFFGMILIIETLSVILQVMSFRFTGKRIFKMSPIHHHFELIGFSEVKVVLLFWGFTVLTGMLGVWVFYLTNYR